jgi:hypothetical protein
MKMSYYGAGGNKKIDILGMSVNKAFTDFKLLVGF